MQFWLVVLFSKMVDRGDPTTTDYVEKAKLAEQAERYEDMAAVSRYNIACYIYSMAKLVAEM